MKTKSKSLDLPYETPGKFCRVGLWVVLLALFVGCSSLRSQEPAKDSAEEYSLKEDRSYLDQLRSDTPEEVKNENDELAFIMKLMGEVREAPDKVRDRFSTEIRKRRERFNKLNQRDRTSFNEKEKRTRETFLSESQKKRDKFVSSKPKSEERKDFFNDQETQRRDFFAKQSEDRKEFESKMRERSSDFDAYIREKQADFNQEQRAYSERYRQYEKDKKAFNEAKAKHEQEQRAKGIYPGISPSSTTDTNGTNGAGNIQEASKYNYDKDLEEFKKIPKTPADRLEAGEQ